MLVRPSSLCIRHEECFSPGDNFSLIDHLAMPASPLPTPFIILQFEQMKVMQSAHVIYVLDFFLYFLPFRVRFPITKASHAQCRLTLRKAYSGDSRNAHFCLWAWVSLYLSAIFAPACSIQTRAFDCGLTFQSKRTR